MLLNKLTDLTVEELCRHALANEGVCIGKCLARDLSRFAHQPQLIGILNNDHRLNTKCLQRKGGGIFYLFLSLDELKDANLCVVILERLCRAVIHFKTT